MDVPLNFDFFQVEPVNGSTFTEALDEINGFVPRERKAEIQGRNYRISHLARDSRAKLWAGDIVRVRMQDLPGIADLESDEIKDIPLGDDEGIGECAAFAFGEADNLLVLQRNRMSIGSHLVSPLLRKISQLDVPWAVLPVPREDALERITQAVEIKNILVRFARVKATQLTISPKAGDVEVVDLINRGVVPSFTLQMSNGRSEEKIDVRAALAFVRRMFSMSGKRGDDEIEIDQLRVRGTDSEGDVLDVKMLEYQLSFQGIASEAKSRRIPYSTRNLFAERAYNQRLAEARRILQAGE